MIAAMILPSVLTLIPLILSLAADPSLVDSDLDGLTDKFE